MNPSDDEYLLDILHLLDTSGHLLPAADQAAIHNLFTQQETYGEIHLTPKQRVWILNLQDIYFGA